MSGTGGKDQILAENEDYVFLYFHSGTFYRPGDFVSVPSEAWKAGEGVVGSRGI